MDAAVYLWSVVVQWVSVAVIALAFLILSRSVKARELGHWFNAWVSNFVAMSAAVGFWWIEPAPVPTIALGALYAGGKLAFVFFLVSGARVLKGTRVPAPDPRAVVAWLALSVAVGSLVDDQARLGLAQQTLLAIGCVVGARISLASPRSTADGWLGGAFALRAALHLSEAAMYTVLLVPDRAPAAWSGLPARTLRLTRSSTSRRNGCSPSRRPLRFPSSSRLGCAMPTSTCSRRRSGCGPSPIPIR